jgi:hypothetical protein
MVGGNSFDVAIALVGDQTLDGDIAYNGPISGSGRVRGQGMGTGPRLAGTHPFSGVWTGRLTLSNGSMPNASMDLAPNTFPGAQLSGNGSVGGAVRLTSVNPGEFGSPGQLSVGSLELVSNQGFLPNFVVSIQGSQPGVGGYSQVVVGGAVNLGGAFLQLTLSPSFTPSQGQAFTLVKNNGGSGVVGQFSGLGQDALITLGSYQFQISYAGGTSGQDVVLTCVFAPNVWTGSVSNLWSNAANWSNGVPQAGSNLDLPVHLREHAADQ